MLIAHLWNTFEKSGEMMSNVKCQTPAFIANGKFHKTVSRRVFWGLAICNSEDFSLTEHAPLLCSCGCWADRTSLRCNRSLQSGKKIGHSLYLFYYPTMNPDTATERWKPVCPWLSVPILQPVSRQQESLCTSARGTEGKNRVEKRSMWCISEKGLRDVPGEWENWGRLDMKHRTEKWTNSCYRQGASDSYSGEYLEGITENR